mgnify:CR=1 FL=1
MGDSFTEGMTDDVVDGKFRGWADRVADELANHHPDFTYMNTAVRGKLVGQVKDDQIPLIHEFVEGKDTLVSFHAGANDVIRPRIDPEAIYETYRQAIRAVAATGCTLMIFTVMEKTAGNSKTSQIWQERFHEFNKVIREVGEEVGAIINEWSVAEFMADRRYLAFDRLHLNQEGHFRLANAVLQNLGYPYDASWKIPLPPAKKKPILLRGTINVLWFMTFALPWIWRRLRGKSSGDGRQPKYPTPTKWPIFSK